MISRSNVEAAWGLIRLHVRRTPVIELSAGSLGVTAPLALWSAPMSLWGQRNGYTVLAFLAWTLFPMLVAIAAVLAG